MINMRPQKPSANYKQTLDIYICTRRMNYKQETVLKDSCARIYPNKSSKPPELGFCCAGDDALFVGAPHRLAIVFSLSISAIVFFPDAAVLLPPAEDKEVFQRSSNPPKPPEELVVAGLDAADPAIPALGAEADGAALMPPNAPKLDGAG